MSANTKAFEEKVRAELQQIDSQLKEFAARSKTEDEKVATDLINQLKTTHQKIETDVQEVNASAVEDMEQEKAEIDAGINKLKAGLAQLATKLKIEPRTKAS